MPKEQNKHPSTKKGETAQEERFRTFFSTTVADIPAEMARRDEEKAKNRQTLFDRLFGKGGKEPTSDDKKEKGLEIPTGEVLLEEKAQTEEQPELDLKLQAKEAANTAPQPQADEPAKTVSIAPAVGADVPYVVIELPKPKKKKVTAKPISGTAKPKTGERAEQGVSVRRTQDDLLPQERREQQELQQFKDMLDGMGAQNGQVPKRAEMRTEKKTVQVKPVSEKPQSTVPSAYFAAEQEKPQQKSIFDMLEPAQDKVKTTAAAKPEPSEQPENTAVQSVPIPTPEEPDIVQTPMPEVPPEPVNIPMPDPIPVPEQPLPAPVPVPTPAEPEKTPAPVGDTASPVQPETEAEQAEMQPESEAVPETTEQRLHRMGAELTLRCVLSGILAIILLYTGFVSDRTLPPLSFLDPDAAPAAFYGANLLLFAGSLLVGYPVLRDGLSGLRGKATADTMPALAAVAALIQSAVAMLNAGAYRNTEGLSLLSGIAALGLFLAMAGSRIMLSAVQNGYELVTNGADYCGAFRARDKDLIRALARDLEQKDPWALLNRPLDSAPQDYVEQSLGLRASERRLQKISRFLLAAAVLSFLFFIITGDGLNKSVGALAAVMCMGAPLSSTLVASLASLRLQSSAASAGAAVPGWAAIEELGGIDTVQVDTDDLFSADSIQLEDLRVFKGGRIDRIILYAASVLNESCGTLRGLFSQIVEGRTEILMPVKDMEEHIGLGFSAWCDNNRILIGNRKYMEQEEVDLPDESYEAQHSKDGELQILYLAVSGNLHAMFILRYVGGRNAARGLAILQHENIRLLVTSHDPSLKTRHIMDAYHLQDGMITMLDSEQYAALDAARQAGAEPCCMYHTKGFAGLTGGLRAADRAQNAETAATSVQIGSVWFSIAIGLLLTYAHSVSGLSLGAVLLYQIAWSGLSLAVGALKQRA